jgi:hypothetical protein
VALPILVHTPPQQSASCPHESPSTTQYDDMPQWPPLLHLPEQHWVSPLHELPSVLQVALSAVQVWLLPQTPPQHSASVVHAPLSDVHWVPEHTLLTQLTEQQSVGALHDELAEPHVVGFAVQAPVGSQMPEQHWLLPLQAEP